MTDPEATSWLTNQLEQLADATAVALLLRHAEREDIPSGSFGNEVRLTSCGVASAERLGRILGDGRVGRTASSPLPRCVDTARAIMRGAGWLAHVAPDWRLGDPGPFVIEPEVVGPNLLEIGIPALVQRQLSDGNPPAGMRPTSEGAELLLRWIAGHLAQTAGLSLYVTHDAILAALVGHLYELPVDRFPWPEYLDALLLWRASNGLGFVWRGLQEGSYPIGG